jgi:hypothetical protein
MDDHFSKHLGNYYKTVSSVLLGIPLISGFSLGVYRSTKSFNNIENPYKNRLYSISILSPTLLGMAGVFAFLYLLVSEKLKPNGFLNISIMFLTFLFLLISVIGYLTIALYDTFLNDSNEDFGLSYGGLLSMIAYSCVLITIILKYMVNRFHPLDSDISQIENNSVSQDMEKMEENIIYL